MYDDLLFVNTVSDIRIKEMVSDTESSEEDGEVPYYPDPSEPHNGN